MAAAVTEAKRRHRFIRASRLYLVVRTVLLPTFTTLQQLGFRAALRGELMIIDGFLGQFIPHFLHGVTGHFLKRRNENITFTETHGVNVYTELTHNIHQSVPPFYITSNTDPHTV